MLRKPDFTNYFNFKPEEKQNPYIGFTSFQHFRGEKLYSDCVVKPENCLCETENYECYPVPYDVEENGREQGYYPDTSLVYIRILWKEFEPQRGVYNYEFIEDILNKAKEHEQMLVFRLIAHSTRARDDVPEWLKEIIPCPDRPDGMRVKDSPTDPRFLEYFSEAVKKIGERFDNNPYFYAIDISLPGSWGEGHNLHLYPDEDIKKLVDVYLDYFKNTQIFGQLAKPDFIRYASTKTNIGWRGDGLGSPNHTENIYPPLIEEVADNWKTGPVSFEAYWWLGEWLRKDWDIDIIIEKTLDWHISSFNAKSLPIPNEWKDKVDYWVSKMGYHFGVDHFSYPSTALPGETAEMELEIANHGVAPIYKKLPLKIRFFNTVNTYVFDTDIDITSWLPGTKRESISIDIPDDIVPGNYDIEVGILNEEIPMIYFCTDAQRNGSFYRLGQILIMH